MAKKKPAGYKLHCAVDKSEKTYRVEGTIKGFVPMFDQYMHVDIELPSPEDRGELFLVITHPGTPYEHLAWFDRFTIPGKLDGNLLHVTPFLLIEMSGDVEKNEAAETDRLELVLYVDGKVTVSEKIIVMAPWPDLEEILNEMAPDTPENPEQDENKDEDEDQKRSEKLQILMDLLDLKPGWHGFKRRIKELVARIQVGEVRKKAGLEPNVPTLHTVIIGNSGTGKTACVTYLAGIFKQLGLLDTDQVRTTRVSRLSASNYNGEYTNTLDAVTAAQGGTLVFDCAHELYKPDNKNYDAEARMVRALVDALGNREKYSRWMLVLIGEQNGVEALLANNPELKKHFADPIYMEDFTPEELFEMIDSCCAARDLDLTDVARKKLEMYILHKIHHRTPGFENAHLVHRLIDEQIIPAMFARIGALDEPSADQLRRIEAQDIPTVNTDPDAGMAELDELIGLGKIKTRIKDYLNAVRLAGRRMELGLPTRMPRLHMAFLGNPGTGKTTVAEIIGKVFASWGILSGGHVIRTEKSLMVGQYIGETEYKMRALLERAQGNILFIDEAYQLIEGSERDYGRIVMNSLLTELGRENPNMVVILAGYTAPMKQLLESNEGIESRFPNVFNFEDYTTDELVEIGKLMIRKQGFTLTEGAEANLRTIIEEESEKPSPRFGNGRFVSNLLQNEILATLGARTSKLENPTREDLSTIMPEDVVIGKAQKDVVFDDVAIDAALARLDALAGLDNVKKAIHNFVESARYLHSIGEPYVGKGLLSWRFIGKSGTGKSTVAEIMACILKGMRLISNSHIVEIKGERIIGVSEADCDQVLREAVKKSCNGLLFVDVDEPIDDGRMSYGRSIEQIRLKVKELTVEAGGECALILAELNAPYGSVAEQLSDAGIYEFDHTLVFKDFTPEELYDILCLCLGRFQVTFSPAAEKHIRAYLGTLQSSIGASARTMKLMSRTIYQQVILRESGLSRRPKAHQVQLADIETFRWNGRKGKIGF